jgi:leader peptidase (prepilin peptidase) / N-methyltransferase
LQEYIDFKHTILPDTLTLPFLWLGLLLSTQHQFTDPTSAIFGAAFGYLFLWSTYWIFKLITQKEGMGYGDFKLMAMLGAWFGWQALPLMIFISSILGAVYGISLMILKQKNRYTAIPFGPFIALAGFIELLYHQNLIEFYFKLIST